MHQGTKVKARGPSPYDTLAQILLPVSEVLKPLKNYKFFYFIECSHCYLYSLTLKQKRKKKDILVSGMI